MESMPDLYAWLGEDEFGSGEVGLKQGVVPAGCIPLVAVNRDKISQDYIVKQMQIQSTLYGKTIRLCRYKMSAEVIVIKPEENHGQVKTQPVVGVGK